MKRWNSSPDHRMSAKQEWVELISQSTHAPCDRSRHCPLSLAWQVHCLSFGCPGARDSGVSAYQPRKEMVRRVGKTQKYEPTSTGFRAMTALLVLRDKVLKPLLAASTETYPAHGAQNPRNLGRHYEAIRAGMQGVFREWAWPHEHRQSPKRQTVIPQRRSLATRTAPAYARM